jgi:REP element-mobilizing transposase RayT
MARPLRLEYPGAVYHITARGNAREPIFLNDEDREAFLTVLASVVDRFNWLCHAYCLMEDHYHLLVETPDANLSRGMRQLNGVYTQGFNRRHNRVGHVLQGRFKSILVDKDNYLLEVARYVVLNPVRAKLVLHPRYWRWCSYTATSGERRVPKFLTVDFILSEFASRRKKAQLAYRQFVAEGRGQTIWEQLRGGVLLGSDAFVKRMIAPLKGRAPLKEVPKAQRFLIRPTLAKLFRGAKRNKAKRNEQIYKAYMEHGYTLGQIGDYLGLHYSTISRIAQQKHKETSKNKA